MRERGPIDRPEPWQQVHQQVSAWWALPFYRLNWILSWASWALSHWALLDVLEHLGTFSVLIAVIFYFAESGNRVKQRHYQAWQVINTAQGKGGNGGRIDALQELNADHVSLVGVDVSGAFLQGIRLENAHLERCRLNAADLRNSDLRFVRISFGDLGGANLRQSDLTGADLSSADLADVDFNGADLAGANLDSADLSRADLRNADLRDLTWNRISSLRLANVYGVHNAPAGFAAFAQAKGAVSLAGDDEWNALLKEALKPANP